MTGVAPVITAGSNAARTWPREGAATASADALREWLNARVGKTQRLAAVHLIGELPRSAIGKVLKRELREHHARGG